MKFILLHVVKAYISLGMFFYFKKITVYHAERVPKKQPVLILSNHQNGLIDPLIIAITCGRFFYFLTRAKVFKKSLLAKIFNALQMIPVYRLQDGWGSISNNNAIFESCTKLLHEDDAIVIFPEGNHNLKRAVRPLSKGFTRVVLDTLEKYPATDLQLVPVGVNYQDALKFPDSVSIYYGEPIAAQNYYSGEKKQDVVPLKLKIQSEISELTTHIPAEHYDETLDKLVALNADFLNPMAVNYSIKNNLKDCPEKPKEHFLFIKKVFRFLLICSFIMPYVVWKFYARPKITELEFLATFRFALTIVLGPFWLLLISLILFAFFGVWVALIYVVTSLIIALLAIKL
ncbi:lysophospholipid acyltransferase family protein [Tamlana sp. I1]|uniref:lysophospholipid acyltransferase family protein n=1 Tax=Tamlana sp. I1 TaxID=2762061 RepID=UPI001E4A1114|nr:lysophospholipid acyltransferase family protein [Tamlana sp. I1]